MKSAKVKSIASKIEQYIKNNPDAKDDLAGISKWWVNENSEIVKKALELLINTKKIKYDSFNKLYSKL